MPIKANEQSISTASHITTLGTRRRRAVGFMPQPVWY